MLTLYEHPFALYCQKVLIALEEQGVAYEVLEEQRDFDRASWPGCGRRRRSRFYATAIRPSARPRSSSSTSRARGWCRRWRPESGTRLCDQYVSDAVQAIVLDTIDGGVNKRAVSRARGRSRWPTACSKRSSASASSWRVTRSRSPTAPAAPGLFYALAIHPWDQAIHPQLTRYYRMLAHRRSFAKVIADARPYRHLFPLPWPADFDRYH